MKLLTHPSLTSFLAFSNNVYTLQELKNMELKVIQNLDFDFLAPTTEEFFSINSDFFEFTEQQRFSNNKGFLVSIFSMLLY